VTTKKNPDVTRFNVVLLAAGRGPNDPMARAFNVKHKCLIDVFGTPMIIRVLNILRKCSSIDRVVISIESADVLKDVPDFKKMPTKRKISVVKSEAQVSQSVLKAIEKAELSYPILITTADHALLTVDMLNHFCSTSAWSSSDVSLGVAHEDVVKMAYPDAKRTFFKFSDGKFSGCNMFGLMNETGLNAVRFWQQIERERKRPWRIVKAFGFGRLATYLGGMLSLTKAMEQASELMDAQVEAVRIPFAEAAIDVDKPEDLVLAEEILARRENKAQLINLDLNARAELKEGDFDEFFDDEDLVENTNEEK
jgi:GTP:adenosylcobinamide-phosphate guanylyltransferase